MIENITIRDNYVARGLLRSNTSADGTLTVYTYTDRCVHEGEWDDITSNSRGHIFDRRTGECVARPFPKFFNVGERDETRIENLPEEAYDVYEKMDGWLGILYRQDGEYKVASRGSLQSSGARWGTEYIKEKNLSFLPSDATLCFEIIEPSHKIILEYDRPDLHILAAFNRFTGYEYPRQILEEWSKRSGLPLVRVFNGFSIRQCTEMAKAMDGVEGFVIRFKNGLRVKVKTDWYTRIARILASMTPISVWNVMREGKVSKDFLEPVPSEFRKTVDGYVDVLENQFAFTYDQLWRSAVEFVDRANGDMKLLAKILEEAPKAVRGFTFAMAREKKDKRNDIVMKLIRPDNGVFVDKMTLKTKTQKLKGY